MTLTRKRFLVNIIMGSWWNTIDYIVSYHWYFEYCIKATCDQKTLPIVA